MKIVKIRIGRKTVNADVADTLFKKAKGLMFRRSAKEGMLFVFNNEGYHSFWMLGMKIPIDIIFIGENKRVVDIFSNVQPGYRIYKPRQKAMYVLETKSNFIKRNKIKVGSKVDFIVKQQQNTD